MYKILKTDGRAKRAEFTTVHGTVQTPVFMNVGTVAAIKGAVATTDLQQIGTQIELSNTYHLHVRPGDKIIKQLGGLHKFMNWDKPILTDSGGFQVFSLAGLRKIKEEGVTFQSHIDGHKIFMGPEESMQIQSNLGSTIAMAFDECAPAKADRKYIQNSVDRTYRWLERCKKEMARLNSLPDTVNPDQMLFGIDQGGVFNDIRINITAYAKEIGGIGIDYDKFDIAERDNNAFNIPDKEAAEKVKAFAESKMSVGDSIGGVIECRVTGMMTGIGNPTFEKLDANLAKAIMSIGAVKGFEIGDGFEAAKVTGKYNNDEFVMKDGRVGKLTNHSGGVLGGISDGDELVFRAAVKPTPSISALQETVNKQGEDIEVSIKGRHDPMIVPRAVVVVEAMTALTLVDLIFDNMTARMDRVKEFYRK